jgi:hypothetical protein
MDKLRAAFKCNRHGHRDWLIKLVIYRHGLRILQTCDLRWMTSTCRSGPIGADLCQDQYQCQYQDQSGRETGWPRSPPVS